MTPTASPRAKAWETRRAKYGPSGHAPGRYQRPRLPGKPVLILISWLGGNCPVQAEGTVNGEPFYFRARGARWSMEIGGAPSDGVAEWQYTEGYQEWPAAGWMPEAEARDFIAKAAALWASGAPVSSAPSERASGQTPGGNETFKGPTS
jgi:hypothetical protein